MIKIIVCGYKGRMGQNICSVIEIDPNLKLHAGIDVGDKLESVINDSDVLIDFSLPQSSVEFTELAVKFQKPIVIGTTGHSSDQEKMILDASNKIAILKSPNMSLGVNLMWSLAKLATNKLDWNTSIIETHHIHKKDSPSGTALKLADVSKNNKTILSFENEFPNKIQPENELWICAKREGEAIGNHKLILKSKYEELTIEHNALNRKVFAEGAVEAARWIVGKEKGFYSISNIIS